jgi:YD repeat-containing protein
MSTTYDYHSESTPGGNEQTSAGRLLDTGTGGYLKQISSPLNTQEFKKYDKRGNIEEFNDTQGGAATYHSNTYDELENETAKSASSLSPLTYSATYGYDNNSNMTSSNTNYGGGEAPVSNTYNYTYTPRNMLHTETEMGRGMTTTYGYDANDNIESISNNIDSISFTYNNRDLVETVRNGTAPGASTFYYDGNGNIRTSADPYGHTYTYQYDGYDRLKEIKDPLNNKTVIQRADMGNKVTLQQLDTAENILRETVRVNDPLGCMTQYAVNLPGAAGETYSYSYQDGGKTTIITDALDRTWTIKKNDQGQVYEETDPAGNKIEYFYEDGRGNMTKKIETEKGEGGTEQTYTTEYTYNSFNKVEIIKEIVAPDNTIYTTFTYDEKGNLTGTKDAEGNIVTHKYDDLGRKIRTEQHFKDGTKITSEFTYYPNDLLKTIKDSKGNITTYEYDDQKRLTKVIYPDDSDIRYTYTFKKINDNDDTIYRVVIEKQRNGTQVTNYYDEMNRLFNRQISLAEGAAGTTAETYEYDGLSRRDKI